MFLPVLAHGGLGYWDEAAFIGLIVVFVAMTFYSWWKSRTLPETPPPSITPETEPQATDQRFELE